MTVYNADMTVNAQALWTIEQLGAQVALALADNYDGQPSGKVRDVPDLRTIRYYTTLGLLDRAAEMRGRTALYSTRHLLQLVAIKRLQARGYTLKEVQKKMLGITDAALRNLANIPTSFWETQKESKQPERGEETRRQRDFWRQAPAPVEQPEETPSTLVQGVRLDEAVTLLLETTRPLEQDDIEAIRIAAEPLLKILEKRRLIERRD